MSPNPQETADLVTFTEEIYSGKLHFLRSNSICKWEHGHEMCRSELWVLLEDSQLANTRSRQTTDTVNNLFHNCKFLENQFCL